MRISSALLTSSESTLAKIKGKSEWRQEIDSLDLNSDEQAVIDIITANIVLTIQCSGITMIGELYKNIEIYAQNAAQYIEVDVENVIHKVMRNL
jgi:CobQ-like glutamine amidotransferase family enzyme